VSPTPQRGEGWLADFSGYSQEALEREIARLGRVADRSAPVLVVDDMQTMRLLLAQSLKQAGYANVFRAAEGESALRTLRQEGCDLALVDWNMPRMDGLELLDRVREDPATDDIVFIMITAETLDLKVMQAAEEKQDAYLTKPISADKLTRRLELILERRLATARALLLELRGEPERAAEQFMAATHNRPRARWPLFGLGGVLARQGRFEEAEGCYRRLLELDPEAAAALVEMGRIREKQGRLAEAREMFRQAMSQSPRFFRAYDALAESMLADDEPGAALEVLEQAMAEQGTQNARRQELKGRLHLSLEQFSRAEDAFLKALDLKPRLHPVANRLHLGRARMAQGLWEEAAEALAEAAELGREESDAGGQLEALTLLATSWAQERETAKAEEALEHVMDPARWPDGRQPWSQRRFHREAGAVYMAAGREEPALRHLTAAIQLDPADEEHLARMQALCEEMGLPGLAGRAQERARREQEQAAEACAKRGLKLVSQGKLAEALAEYHRGLAMDPRSGRLHFNLGKLLQRLQDPQGALAAMISAARLGRERRDWELNVEVARFLAGRGHLRQAKSLLLEVLGHSPEMDRARQLLEGMEQGAAARSETGAGS
jgi:tetratricopeptide (TPR) repeat protein